MREWGWLGAGVSIFWVDESGWTFFMGGWEWVEVYFGWVGLCGHFMSGWGWVEVYFGWVGMGGGIFWVGGDGWG